MLLILTIALVSQSASSTKQPVQDKSFYACAVFRAVDSKSWSEYKTQPDVAKALKRKEFDVSEYRKDSTVGVVAIERSLYKSANVQAFEELVNGLGNLTEPRALDPGQLSPSVKNQLLRFAAWRWPMTPERRARGIQGPQMSFASMAKMTLKGPGPERELAIPLGPDSGGGELPGGTEKSRNFPVLDVAPLFHTDYAIETICRQPLSLEFEEALVKAGAARIREQRALAIAKVKKLVDDRVRSQLPFPLTAKPGTTLADIGGEEGKFLRDLAIRGNVREEAMNQIQFQSIRFDIYVGFGGKGYSGLFNLRLLLNQVP